MSKKRWVLAAAGMGLVAAVILAAILTPRPGRRGRVRPTDGGLTAGDADVRGSLKITGKIMDLHGRGVSGAEISVAAELHGGAWEGTSDAEGRFEVAVRAGRYRIAVQAPGYRGEELRQVEAPDDVEIALGRRLRLEGVARAGGRAAADALIEVAGGDGFARARSGPDGAFGFAALAEGRYALRATRGSEAAYLEVVTVSVDPDAGSGLVTVELVPAGRVTGRVLDRLGKPIAGAEVTLAEGALAPLPRKQLTASDGSFAFAAVLPGSYMMAARADGYYPDGPRPVAAPAKGVEVRLERGGVVEGRVLDEQARPIAGAHLEVSGEGTDGAPIALTGVGAAAGESARLEPSGELGILRGPIPFPPPVAPAKSDAPASVAQKTFVSDDKGGFKLIGLPAGRLVVAAAHPDFARGTSEPVQLHAGASATVQLVLRRGATVHGRVTDERDLPLAAAELTDGAGRMLAITDGRGLYTIEHVAGALKLSARHPGHLPATREVAAGEVAALGPSGAAGGAERSETIDFRLARAEGRLSGVVVDDRGGPLSGAKLEIGAPGLPAVKALTDGRGSFRAEALGPGPYRVAITHPDFAPLEADAIAPGDDAHFQLAPGAGIAGEVADARSGQVPAGLHLELVIGAKSIAIKLLRGRFEATGLPAGRALLKVSAAGYVPYQKEVTLEPGDRPRAITLRDLRLDLERGGRVTGRIRDDIGLPVGAATVTCGAAQGKSDARGEFHLDGVAPGRCTVRVESLGRQLTEEVEVRADDESRLDLRLRDRQ